MSNKILLKAEARSGTGKGAARRARREGKLPAVVYGKGGEATSITVEPRDFVKAMKGPFRRNAIVELDVDGKKHLSMVKEVQINPLRREPTHVDFCEVQNDQEVTVKVPFFTTGKSKAVTAGAKLQIALRYLRLRSTPEKIPEKITYDITDVSLGAYRAKSIELPEGVSLVDDGHVTVFTVARGRGAAAATTEEAEG